ncbi:MAG: hypothetical protein SangKO_046350 [Sandaracinaceae bacterium]
MIPLVLAMLAVPAGAAGQRGQRNPLLSERAFGLGGAVVASAAGPSAAYYNPAGLADTPGTAAGASLSLRTFRSYTLVDGYNSVLGLSDLTDSGLLSVPVFLGAVLKFGPRDATNVRQHALAAGSAITQSVDRELLDDDADLGRGIASTLEVRDTQEVRWFYVAYAFRPSNQVSLGVTAALSIYDREYRENWSQAIGLTNGGTMGTLVARDVRVDVSATSLALRFGASWRPDEWVQLSVMFQAPGIELFDSGRAFFQRVTADASMPEGSGFFRVNDEQLDVQATLPWELRVGSYFRLDPRLGVGLDLGLTGSEGSPNDPVFPLGQPVPLDGDRPAATYFPDSYWTDVIFDAAIGAEIQITEEIPLRFGTFFELSGLPAQMVGERTRYLPDRVDRLGVSAGFGVQGDRYDFGLGLGYVHGFGTGFRPVDPFGPGYVRTDVQSHEIHIFFSGVTGAATQLALDTYRAVTGSGFEQHEEVSEDALDHVDELHTEEELEERRAAEHETPQAQQLEDLPRWILDSLETEDEAEAPTDEQPEDYLHLLEEEPEASSDAPSALEADQPETVGTGDVEVE